MYKCKEPLKGYEWKTVSEEAFDNFCEENYLVRQTNGRVQEYYDCGLDYITAVQHLENTELGPDFVYDIMVLKKEKK